MIFKRILNKICRYLVESSVQRRDPNDLEMLSRGSLLFSYGNVYSQVGQDGIIHEILSRIERHLPENRAFVEFGAWDGVYLSNCRWLVEQGWHGVFIEGDPKKFVNLESNYRGLQDKIKCVNTYVGAPNRGIGKESVADIVKKCGANVEDICFVVIDVDGLDLEIFQDLGLKPAVIMMEGGRAGPDQLDRGSTAISVALRCRVIHGAAAR